MKKTLAYVLAFCLMAGLCACQTAQVSEPSVAESKVEATRQPVATPTAEPTPETAVESVNPYAWLGYDELPACAYFNEISSQVFYREYDLYALGYVSHVVEASDGVNVYSLDSQSGILSLILDGEAYSFHTGSMMYTYRDMTDSYQTTLEQRVQRMEQGIDTTGKEYKGTGSEPIPLYCDEGDAASYAYYEFFTDGKYPMTERIYFKDGDAFAIYTGVATGADEASEATQVITAHNASPDPSLFALPSNFNEYTLYE